MTGGHSEELVYACSEDGLFLSGILVRPSAEPDGRSASSSSTAHRSARFSSTPAATVVENPCPRLVRSPLSPGLNPVIAAWPPG
jgi:hypothetical protein